MDVISLLPQVGGLAFTIITFVAVLSVIVAVHEYGHYIVGRWSGIHAEVFSLGFGPVLWSRVDKRGTRWQIAALPFGGFVKFLGDSNAASGKDADAMAAAEGDAKALRRTMHGAPLWARSATVAAGPVFNFILSAVIFCAILMAEGTIREPLTVGSVMPLPGVENQLREGDEILAIAGSDVPDFSDRDAWSDFTEALPIAQDLTYTVERAGEVQQVTGPILSPPLVRSVAPRSAASDIGIAQGDVITAVDGQPIFAFSELKDLVESGEGKVLLLDIWRDGQTLEFALAPRATDEPQPDGGFATQWRIGIVGGMAFDPGTETMGLGEAAWGGVRQVAAVIEMSLSGLKHMITGAISTCNLSGPIGIAETSSSMARQGGESFLRFIAVISTAVGLMNLFPVPALDGGHLVFYAYEAVVGRPPHDRALQLLMTLGIALVLTMMLFALGNDIFC
ncbi:RIP metalloprotease RseP [Epibacterium sp. SM1979]|uniref:Zinc metalloprotease n=1 Tax=Tritonibacter litoralis TaxID=2662264 RepID=A0A843YEG9_9RHOB|nr:RIP metalloprotease RseP [Tritonibacter litoralis]MQQ07247.1 RIP metalloprotease RseP [Tritonibacter litoralis]